MPNSETKYTPGLPFDTKQLKLPSEPLSVAAGVGRLNDRAYFSISENGILVYRRRSIASRLCWKDRVRRTISSVGGRTTYVRVALSPGGKRVFVEGNGDIWMIELATDIVSRFTLAPSSEADAIWSIVTPSTPTAPFFWLQHLRRLRRPDYSCKVAPSATSANEQFTWLTPFIQLD